VEKSARIFPAFALASQRWQGYFVTMLTDAQVTVAFILHDLSRQMRHAFDQRARNLGVTRQQWRALFYLSRFDGPTQTELADALEVERISVGRMVDRLVDGGLVERRADPADRRVWRLHLLPPACEILKKLTAIGAALEAEVLEEIAPEKRQELVNLLEQVRDGVKRVRVNFEDQRNVA
jgi:MarR family transcriptional regulator, transcriptional regulator for hemolysin